jgi:hypothetical protein
MITVIPQFSSYFKELSKIPAADRFPEKIHKLQKSVSRFIIGKVSFIKKACIKERLDHSAA